MISPGTFREIAAPDLSARRHLGRAGMGFFWAPWFTAATGGAGREQFIAALHGETGLGNTWTHGFLAGPTSPENTTNEQNGRLP
jgi:hypothetical protein